MSFYVPTQDHPEERACLVGVRLRGCTQEQVEENLDELEQLAATADAKIVARKVQKRLRIDSSTFVGKGMIELLRATVDEEKVNLVIFDDELSPAQARNIENILKVNVIDRTELILDIFSKRARTRQAKIQVEIAQLTYALPRLKRLWEHLSRQSGGIGTRGPGETQLEVDRRRVRERITHLKEDLETINRRTAERRKARREAFNVTIVGYTNAGKSTLLNRVSGSSVLESGKLFSTLDSTTRRVHLEGAGDFVLTDTIGFIRKLPAHLVASFKATLMDVENADLLLHVVDSSSPGIDERIEVVNDVLRQVLGSGNGKKGERVPTILVLNKIDRIGSESERTGLLNVHPEALAISAATGEGTEGLLRAIRVEMEKEFAGVEIRLPVTDGRSIAFIEAHARVESRELEEEHMVFRAMIRKKDLGRLESSADIEVRLLKAE